MRGIEQQGRSPRSELSGWVNGRKEAEEVVGNEPILVLLGAACGFEAKLEGLATIDLPKSGNTVATPSMKIMLASPGARKSCLR